MEKDTSVSYPRYITMYPNADGKYADLIQRFAGYFTSELEKAIQNDSNFKNKVIPQAVKKILGGQKIQISIDKVKEQSGVYEFQLTLDKKRKFTSYITKDGEILFVSGIKLNNLKNKPTAQKPPKKLTCKDLKKAEQQ